MSPLLSFSPSDRLMVIAPHPDDESLATGGLLQRALRSGAQVRVVFASDGGNNPWPQRVMERRWAIEARDQQRWGLRRRREAFAALTTLGLSRDDAQFLDFRDQGCTDALLHAADEAADMFQSIIESWKPTLVVAPSLHDLHPDHSALSILVSMALDWVPAGERPEVLHYLVHARREHLPTPIINLHLGSRERDTKREAILCHATQMALSRKRFTSYARDVEQFFPTDAEDPAHPIRSIVEERGSLCIRVPLAKVPFVRGELWLACDGRQEDCVRWRIPLSQGPSKVRIQGGPSLDRSATVRRSQEELEIRVPLAPLAAASRLFIKLHRRLAFYDEAGWREIFLPAHAPVLCSDTPLSEALFSSCSFAASYSGGGSES